MGITLSPGLGTSSIISPALESTPSGRRSLRASQLVAVEDPLGPVELARDVVGTVKDRRGGALQHKKRDVRAQHPRLEAGGIDDVPDRLVMTVEVEGEGDEVEPVVTGARLL